MLALAKNVRSRGIGCSGKYTRTQMRFAEVSSCFTASVAGRTAAERRCSARRWHRVRLLWKRSDQKGRATQHLCNDEYAIGGGALSRRCHLLQSSSSRLRHQRTHERVPNCSELIFDIAAGRHKLSDTDRWLDARPWRQASRGRGKLQVIVPLQRVPCRGADSDVTL